MSIVPLDSSVVVFNDQQTQQRRRSSALGLNDLTCSDVLTLEKSVERFEWEKVTPYMPAILR